MKQGAIDHLHKEASAVVVEVAGWSLPARFVDVDREVEQVRTSVGLADVSNLTKIDLLSAAPPNGNFDRWTLGRRHYLVTAAPGRRDELAAWAGESGIDVTSVFGAFLLSGPRSREVFSKLTSLNASDSAMPDRSCAQTSLAHVHATILRKDLGGLPGYLILTSRDYAEHVWESLLHAGHEYGITRFGLEALARLEG